MKNQTLNDGRNYTIDLLRIIAAFLMSAWHWIWLAVMPGEVNGGYWGSYFFCRDFALQGWDWFKGTYTMGFFVFTTGYFMMDGFKRQQAKGAFIDKRTHFTHTWRFTAKTYCSYAPLMMVGTVLAWLLINITSGANLMRWIQTFFWNIWQFLGVSGFGMFQNFMYSGAAGGSEFIAVYNGPIWYIAAFIVGACIFYSVLIRNEKAAVFVLCPIMFMSSNIWLNQWLNEAAAEVEHGITNFLPMDVVRLWGPLSLGIWGWYLGNALKNAKMTSKQENALGIAWLVVLLYCLITAWTGFFGGMLNQDILWMFVALVAIVNRDPVTRGINVALHKFPLSKYFADLSSGLYVVHNPILMSFSAAFIALAGGNLTKGGVFYEIVVVCSALLFIPVYRMLVKPLYGKLANLLNARGPVTVPAYYDKANA